MSQTINPVKRLWNLLHEEKGDITAIYFFAILGGGIQLSLPVGIQAIIGYVLGGVLSASLVVLISVLVVAVLLTGVMQLSQMRLIEKIQQRIFTRYAFAFADRIPRLDAKTMDAYYLPELVNRFFDTASLQKSLSKMLLDIPAASIQILFGLLLLSLYHPFFIFFGLLLLLLLWIIIYLTGNKGLDSSLTESRHKYAVAGWLEEMARLNTSFKMSSFAGLHLKKTDEKTIAYLNARTLHFGVLQLQYKTLIFFKVAITAAMLTLGVVLLLNQQLNIGQFVAAEIIIITVINAVEKIIVNLDSVYDVLTAVEKISKLTDKPVEASGTYTLTPGAGVELEARHLHYGYEPGKWILKDLSFSIPHGSKVCISGQDGAGKSTLLKLLLGVYKDFTGSLTLNGLPVGNYNLESVRENTGILFAQENIFHGTLMENITLGRTSLDVAYIASLVKEVGLQPFLATLPNGYDTELEPTGMRLPRNVVQKILLVRALAHKPKLLVMEDPWQHIEDPYTTQIQQLFLELPDTTVIVATRNKAYAARCHTHIQLTL